MDFGKAFSYVFEDPDWFKKVGIASLVGLIPIIGQLVVMGFALQTARNVMRGEIRPLADLDFSSQLGLGFKSFVVALVYSLPLIILSIPIVVLPLLLSGNGKSPDTTLQTLRAILTACCSGLMILYGLAMAFLVPAATANLVAKDSLAAGLRFGEVIGLIKSNPGAWLLVFLGSLVSGFISPLGSIACGIGAILTTTYAMLINSHLYAQAFKKSAYR